MAKEVYSLEEIKAIHTRALSKIGKIYKTNDRVYEGISLGKLQDITEQTDITNNITNININEETGQENSSKIKSNTTRIVALEEAQVSKCYILAMSIVL